MSERTKYIDIAKGLGITAVVVGHSGAPTFISYILYYFHLPLLYLLSGYSWKDEYLDNIPTFIKKKIRGLYMPYIKWQIFFLLIHNLIFNFYLYSTNILYAGNYTFAGVNYVFTQNIYNIKEFLAEFVRRITIAGGGEQLLGASWFIVSLIMVFFWFCSISYFTRNKDEWLRFAIIASFLLLGFYFSKESISMERYMNASFIGMSFFYLGYLLKKIEGKVLYILPFSILSLTFILIARIKYNIIVEIASNHYPSLIVFLILAISGIYLTLCVSKLFEKNIYLSNIFSYIGQRTLPIMFMHFIAFKVVILLYLLYKGLPLQYLARFPVFDYSETIWIIYSIAGIFIPIILHEIYNLTKNKVQLKKI